MACGLRSVWIVLLGTLALASAPAWAADGRITFSGAVVQPTCGIATLPSPDPAGPSGVQFGCGGTPVAPAAAAQVLARTVIRLSAHERDPVLQYFSDYVAAGDPAAGRPVLVTQTYE